MLDQETKMPSTLKKMRLLTLVLVILIVLTTAVGILAAPSFSVALWQTVGDAGFSADKAYYTSLAFDDSSTPYVAYSDGDNSDKATVMKFTGKTWETVGLAGFSDGTAQNISLALDGNTPYVAYPDGGNSDKATVMKFNGTTWEAVGSAGFSMDQVSYTSLAFNSGMPYVAYSDWSIGTGGKATVMKFNGTIWEAVGSTGFSAGATNDISLDFTGSTPYIAYSDWSTGTDGKATVMKFNGTTWETIGSVGFSADVARDISLTLDGGTPYIAYTDLGNSAKATVMKFNGSTWEPVGDAGFSVGAAKSTSLALNGGTPYIAYMDFGNSKKATVMKYEGGNWISVGDAGFSADKVYSTSLAFDGNTPYVAYSDTSKASRATVMKYAVPPTIVFGANTVPATGATLTTGPTQIFVEFSEDVTEASAQDEANYMLVEAGANSTFDTKSCGPVDPDPGGLLPDDIQITVNTATYDNSDPFIVTLDINGGIPLPIGKYQLFVCGTTSIENGAGVHLNGGADSVLNFTVQATASSLPETGFRHGEVTRLPHQPTAKAYTSTAMLLDIPKIGVSMPIVGVPQSGDSWDVTWLGNSAGYLSGSAFPTWAGNTVITGHVWDAYNQPGIFSELKTLRYGDQIQIQAWGVTYTYEVRESKLVTKKNVNAAFQSEEYDWLTLVTCEFYNPFTGDYLFRRAVRAVLVDVK